MSIRATNFVRGLRGLTPIEKLVAFVIADHCNLKTGLCTASMTTVAIESGLAAREVASRIVKRLLTLGVITTDAASKGRRTTPYKMNYAYVTGDAVKDPGIRNCDSPITAENTATVTYGSRLEILNRDSDGGPTVTLEGANRDSPVTGRVRRGEGVQVLEAHSAGSSAAKSSSEGVNPKPDDDDVLPASKSFQPSAEVNGKPKPPVEEKKDQLSKIRAQALRIISKEYPAHTTDTINAVFDVILSRATSKPRSANFLVNSFRYEAEDCEAKGGKLEYYVLIARLHRGVEDPAGNRH